MTYHTVTVDVLWDDINGRGHCTRGIAFHVNDGEFTQFIRSLIGPPFKSILRWRFDSWSTWYAPSDTMKPEIAFTQRCPDCGSPGNKRYHIGCTKPEPAPVSLFEQVANDPDPELPSVGPSPYPRKKE